MKTELNLSQEDLNYIKSKNIGLDGVTEQIKLFEKGTQYSNLDRACTPNDGIIVLTDAEIDIYSNRFEHALEKNKVMKFVPASGAASRMFKHLHAYKNGEKNALVDQFIAGVKQFAFYPSLIRALEKDGIQLGQLLLQKDYETLFSYLLSEKGLNYGFLPKAMIDFHAYNSVTRKSIDEHFVEGAKYAKNDNQKIHLHFTVSEDHLDIIKDYVAQVQSNYELEYGVTYEIEFSTQSGATDTIAVDNNNAPFRKDDGQLLFRPSGHGALLDNLNKLDADIIFIKNIDNVTKEDKQETTYQYKKALAGLLVEYQSTIHSVLNDLNKGVEGSEEKAIQFATQKLGLNLSEDISSASIIEALNKPIRVCGMVKNEGEPGGGPFWVKSNQQITPQIVESAQIDKEDENQLSIMKNSTHFNPVDLICGTKDYQGNKFELTQYRDMNTIFITPKSLQGRDLKALELPGLWNGAMADWITLFVEVPLITFNPVKTVNDLLKENHQ